MIIFHQIKNVKKEIQMIKKNQTKIVELKIKIT